MMSDKVFLIIVRNAFVFPYNVIEGWWWSLERNYTNYNEVYPILDMINRRIKQLTNKPVNHFFESPILDGGSSSNYSEWEVESFEVIRDTENAVDPEVIKQIIVVYRNGAVDEITLIRGLNPPVDSVVDDHEYINNLMIVEVHITTRIGENVQQVIARIFRENGYGLFQKVELDYTLDGEHWDSTDDNDIEDPIEEYPPEDFYGGGSAWDGEDDGDLGIDYAGVGYSPDDEIEPSESGWEDGYNPSDPIDVDAY